MKNPITNVGRRMREDALDILRSALADCSPAALLSSLVARTRDGLAGPGFRVRLGESGRIRIVSYGKASSGLARAFLGILPARRVDGMVVRPAGTRERVPGLTNLSAAHPVPDERSLRAGSRILQSVARARPDDLVVHLISGGGSSLLVSPLRALLNGSEKMLLHRHLAASGLGIGEINAIRKHFSALKGGRLLLRSPRARHLSLILSDVPAGALEVVAGGPTLPDPTDWDRCLSALRRSGILGELPARLRFRLARGGLPETPKPGDPRFRRHRWMVVGSGEDLVGAAARRARELGYRIRILRPSVEEPVEAALERYVLLREKCGQESREPYCFVGGGEALGQTRGMRGWGGRAQDFAAAAARSLAGEADWLFLAAGSDGVDGNSPAAGALADGATLLRSRREGLDLDSLRAAGDTYHLFSVLGDAILTGPTGNNLRDLYLLLGQRAVDRPFRSASGGRRGSSGRERR